MINQFAHNLILIAFQIWSFDKAESYRKYMDAILHKPYLTEIQVNAHAMQFTYLPPNAIIRRERDKALNIDYRYHPTYEQ